jgi:sugar/nucleoside kinase (ribokinase family)
VDTADVAVLDGDATGTALIVVDRDGENQIVVCPGANSAFSLEGVEFAPDETVLCQLEVGLPVVLEAARKSSGFFVLNAAPAMDLPAELLERCDLVIVNETEYELIPALAEAKLVAVTYGKDGSAMFEHGRKGGRGACCRGDGGEHDRRGRRILCGAGAGAAGWAELRAGAGRGQRCGGGCGGRSVVAAGAGATRGVR